MPFETDKYNVQEKLLNVFILGQTESDYIKRLVIKVFFSNGGLLNVIQLTSDVKKQLSLQYRKKNFTLLRVTNQQI